MGKDVSQADRCPRGTATDNATTDPAFMVRRLALIIANSKCDATDERAVIRALQGAGVDAGDIVLYADRAAETARSHFPQKKKETDR